MNERRRITRKCVAVTLGVATLAGADAMALQASKHDWTTHRQREAILVAAAPPLKDAAWAVAPGPVKVERHLGLDFPQGERGRDTEKADKALASTDGILGKDPNTKGSVDTDKLRGSVHSDNDNTAVMANISGAASILEDKVKKLDSQASKERNHALGEAAPFALATLIGAGYLTIKAGSSVAYRIGQRIRRKRIKREARERLAENDSDRQPAQPKV